MKIIVSLVVPARNEEQNLVNQYKEIFSVLSKLKIGWELIFVDDGSTDNSWQIMRKIRSRDKRVKIVRLRGNWGKAVALREGFDLATGEIIFSMDADLQDDASEIPNFIKQLKFGYDVVIGWKRIRHDPIEKVISSRIFNWLVRILTNTNFNDINCGFKAYKKEVLRQINFGELFRFIPVLAVKRNFKVKEIAVNHRPRIAGKSNFGWERSVQGFLDLITVVFLTGFSRRPSQFFGPIGLISIAIGTVIGFYIAYLRFTTGGIAFRMPLLFLGVLMIIVGVQFVSTGLLAEMVVGNNKKVDGVILEREL